MSVAGCPSECSLLAAPLGRRHTPASPAEQTSGEQLRGLPETTQTQIWQHSGGCQASTASTRSPARPPPHPTPAPPASPWLTRLPLWTCTTTACSSENPKSCPAHQRNNVPSALAPFPGPGCRGPRAAVPGGAPLASGHFAPGREAGPPRCGPVRGRLLHSSISPLARWSAALSLAGPGQPAGRPRES